MPLQMCPRGLGVGGVAVPGPASLSFGLKIGAPCLAPSHLLSLNKWRPFWSHLGSSFLPVYPEIILGTVPVARLFQCSFGGSNTVCLYLTLFFSSYFNRNPN